ncbi:MAG: hypothetical protein WCJ86_00315 [Candidatus Saccharibacteria bacterium]
MIQFNLLPDVKLAFIKARKLKRLVMVGAASVTTVSLAAVILLFIFVNVAQKKHLSDISKNIASNENKIKGTKDLDKILTIQNQLNSLTALHDGKPVASRLFGYMNLITPANVSLSTLSIDFASGALTVGGTADALSTVNKFVDTIKFTTYTIDGQTTSKKVFSSTVLSSFAKTTKNSTYSVSTIFDPLIFDANTKLSLTVPKVISTRSETEKPDALFQQQDNVKVSP